jgi:hypothetical protein
MFTAKTSAYVESLSSTGMQHSTLDKTFKICELLNLSRDIFWSIREKTSSITVISIQVSPLTEREQVYRWLGSVDSTSPTPNSSLPGDGHQGDAALLTASKLCQTVGFVSLGVAESLRSDARFREACDVYKYALGIFQDHPPSECLNSLRNQQDMTYCTASITC